MEKQMVQCEDGRRRQARIHGVPKEEGSFKVWKAGVRLKGKHVSNQNLVFYHRSGRQTQPPDGPHPGYPPGGEARQVAG